MRITLAQLSDICANKGFNAFIYDLAEDSAIPQRSITKTMKLAFEFNRLVIKADPAGSSVCLTLDNKAYLKFCWVKYVAEVVLSEDASDIYLYCEEIGDDFQPKTVVHKIMAIKY